MLDKSQIGVVCKSSRATREIQITRLREAGAQWIVEIGHLVKSWRDVAKVVRPGDTVYFYALSLVPTKRGEDGLSPSTQIADCLIEIHSRGGSVVEVYTGRRSKDATQRKAMLADARKALKRGSRSLPPTGRGRGRPSKEFPLETIAAAKEVWFSRDYATNLIAAKYLPKGINYKWAWRLFGASGRPFKRQQKRKIK